MRTSWPFERAISSTSSANRKLFKYVCSASYSNMYTVYMFIFSQNGNVKAYMSMSKWTNCLIAVFFFELQALDKLLHDPKFAEAAKEIGSTLTDQITRPLDRAIWWVEHVMRHPTMYAGKSPVHKLHWHQYFLLDVLAVYALILYITYQILKFFFILCFCSDSSKEKRD